jgi:hypothetical protein
MSKDFPKFSKAIRANWADIINHNVNLFRVDIERDHLWDHYLASFPEGTDPMYRERTEHDCSCCRQFIKNVAGAVAINHTGTGLVTVWSSMDDMVEPYRTVAAAMDQLVKSAMIANHYRTAEEQFGVDSNFEMIADKSITYHHFSAKMPTYVQMSSDMIPTFLGKAATSMQVFTRGLTELKPSVLATVYDLCSTKDALYRGDTYLQLVSSFIEAQTGYLLLNSDQARNIYLWQRSASPALMHFRNSAIGNLCVNLTEGMDLEEAVRMFEASVAPENYKRTTKVVTQGMIDKALADIDLLGLRPALDRRHAKLDDISINNVLWASNEAQTTMKDGLRDLLVSSAKPAATPNFDNATEITFAEFEREVLPGVTSMKTLMKSEHQSQLVNVTAPVNTPEEGHFGLFPWDNDFAWSYNGNLADSSIATRVKKAGGRVDNALMRFSLAWFNTDDLDIHVRLPDRTSVSFNNKRGLLDVDMNCFSNLKRDAVENVSWMDTPPDGVYQIVINNYRQRETIDVGFEVEVVSGDKTYMLTYPRAVRGNVHVANVLVKKGQIETIETLDTAIRVDSDTKSTKIWNVDTNTMVDVTTVMYSPNFWDGQESGLRHTMFMLKGAFNPDATRGIYNEFLAPSLNENRRVFDLLGAKTMIPAEEGFVTQLAGLGFTAGRDSKKLSVVVQGPSLNKAYNIVF